MLRAGLLPLWRDTDTVQIGIDPRRAVAFSGMAVASAVIGLLDGSRDRETLIAAAEQHGVPRAATERVLTLLAAAGVLVDCPARLLRPLPADRWPRLAPVLAAASIAAQDGDGGARILARRAGTVVEVRGTGPVAAGIAGLLTQSGLATVTGSPGSRRGEPGPAAITGSRGSRNRDPGLAAIAGSSSTSHSDPDLVVIVGQQPPGLETGGLALTRPHLMAYAGEAIGVVGPLVRPGASACLRCLDLTRTDRDPAWPLILAQLTRRHSAPVACDPILAAMVAAQTAAQAVAFADGAALAEATVNGTLELVMPAWTWRRRTWLPHPACLCRAAAAPGHQGHQAPGHQAPGHQQTPERPSP